MKSQLKEHPVLTISKIPHYSPNFVTNAMFLNFFINRKFLNGNQSILIVKFASFKLIRRF